MQIIYDFNNSTRKRNLYILEEQAYELNRDPPKYLNEKANFICGSVLGYDGLYEIIKEHEVIIHLSAMVGVGNQCIKLKNKLSITYLG